MLDYIVGFVQVEREPGLEGLDGGEWVWRVRGRESRDDTGNFGVCWHALDV